MRNSRFTEEQIEAVLREQEGGVATAEVCRKHGISSPTFTVVQEPRVRSLRHLTPYPTERA